MQYKNTTTGDIITLSDNQANTFQGGQGGLAKSGYLPYTPAATNLNNPADTKVNAVNTVNPTASDGGNGLVQSYQPGTISGSLAQNDLANLQSAITNAKNQSIITNARNQINQGEDTLQAYDLASIERQKQAAQLRKSQQLADNQEELATSKAGQFKLGQAGTTYADEATRKIKETQNRQIQLMDLQLQDLVEQAQKYMVQGDVRKASQTLQTAKDFQDQQYQMRQEQRLQESSDIQNSLNKYNLLEKKSQGLASSIYQDLAENPNSNFSDVISQYANAYGLDPSLLASKVNEYANIWEKENTKELNGVLYQKQPSGTWTKVAGTEKSNTQYGSGVVGEYQFYADQEKAVGRIPLSFNDYQTMDANRKARAQKILTGGLSPQDATRVDRIAGQFDNEPIVKNYNILLEAKNFINSISNNTKNPADQQGMIYAFAKAMDPGSVVREGEYATVQKYAQSWANTFGFDAARIFSNSPFLTSEAIKNMKETIEKKVDASDAQYKNLSKEYGRRIDRITGQDDGTSYISNYSAGSIDTTPNSIQSSIQSALTDGHSPKDIVGFLSSNPKVSPLIQQARGQGYSDDEIVKFLQTFNQPLSDGNSAQGMRTDRHNNPTAFTTDIARIAGLQEGVDYVPGDSFSNGRFTTARLIGDPIDKTIKVIDKIGFYTKDGKQRWTHTALSKSQWDNLDYDEKKKVIAQMYQHEGGKQLKNLFS